MSELIYLLLCVPPSLKACSMGLLASVLMLSAVALSSESTDPERYRYPKYLLPLAQQTGKILLYIRKKWSLSVLENYKHNRVGLIDCTESVLGCAAEQSDEQPEQSSDPSVG